MRVPWTARRSKQSILKEITPEYSLEGLMWKLKLQYFGHLMVRTDLPEKTLILAKIESRRRLTTTPILCPPDAKNCLIGKDPDARKVKAKGKGMREHEMVGWHRGFNGLEFQQALGVGDGQGILVCYSPWGCTLLDTTKQMK